MARLPHRETKKTRRNMVEYRHAEQAKYLCKTAVCLKVLGKVSRLIHHLYSTTPRIVRIVSITRSAALLQSATMGTAVPKSSEGRIGLPKDTETYRFRKKKSRRVMPYASLMRTGITEAPVLHARYATPPCALVPISDSESRLPSGKIQTLLPFFKISICVLRDVS